VTDSTINGNSAASGGGLWSDTNLTTETLTVVGSTISGNTATTSGGGLFNSDGRTVIRHSTITNNTAPGSGGSGIGSAGNGSTRTELRSSIVAADSSSDIALVGGTTNSFQSNGHNLVGSGHSTGNPINEFVETGDQVGANPMLGSLANNGGPTFTHVLMPGSAAINAGNPAAVAGSGGVPQYDQRGTPHGRILGGRIDIGAIEIDLPPKPDLTGDYNLNNKVDAGDYVVWRKMAGMTVLPFSGADGNGDSVVNQVDFMLWRENFGTTGSGSGAGASTIEESPADASLELQTSEPASEGQEVAPADQDSAIWFDLQPTSPTESPKTMLGTTTLNAGGLADNLLLVIDSLYTDYELESAESFGSDLLSPDDQAIDTLFAEIGDAHRVVAEL
jgi:hypothetical protein